MAGDLVASAIAGERPFASAQPESVTQCNCSLCAKTGFRGVYFSSA